MAEPPRKEFLCHSIARDESVTIGASEAEKEFETDVFAENFRWSFGNP
jgi:hypothetical protein